MAAPLNQFGGWLYFLRASLCVVIAVEFVMIFLGIPVLFRADWYLKMTAARLMVVSIIKLIVCFKLYKQFTVKLPEIPRKIVWYMAGLFILGILQADFKITNLIAGIIMQLAWFILVWLYFKKSKRVLLYYGGNA
jgi:hypothetical protein